MCPPIFQPFQQGFHLLSCPVSNTISTYCIDLAGSEADYSLVVAGIDIQPNRRARQISTSQT